MRIVLTVATGLLVCVAGAPVAVQPHATWPGFRGPAMNGLVPAGATVTLPIEW
ncbi:MAG: hypothetical protein O2917_04920 [Acidobacteria bacterium]|nr:hypothetical protein [Acidobacteriota bacterium]